MKIFKQDNKELKDFFLRKKKEGKQLIFFEKIDKNTSREQIKENIKNLLIKQGFKYVPSKKDNK